MEFERLGAEPEIHRIEELQSRYVFAFQRTLRDFVTLFPGHQAMGSIDIGEEGDPSAARARRRSSRGMGLARV